MKFGIVSSKDIKKTQELSEKLREFLGQKGQEVVDDLIRAEVVVTLGGDGTLLHGSCKNIELGVPFVGINLGNLGFLTAAEVSRWQEAMQQIIDGKYFISERMTIEATIGQSSIVNRQSTIYRALNEIVVKAAYRVVTLEITVNGEKFLNISGDGVIVSTQTGSTGYSLSAGGPIVDPDLDCFLITPVNAQGLPVPSALLSPKDEIEVKVIKGDDVSLIIDGQVHIHISQGQSVKIKRGEYRVKLMYFDKHQFLKSLNSKFGLAARLAGD
jgi:NAD+ kinase